MTPAPRSLRATLLIAYGVGMCVVLGAFGIVAQTLYWRSLVGDLDADLFGRARAVARSIALDEDGQFEILMPADVRAYLVDQPDVYYAVRRADGAAIDFSSPDLAIPSLAPQSARTRDHRREVAVPGNGDTLVIMGRSLQTPYERYNAFARTMVAAGIAALAVALLSGWLVMRRFLAPIERIGRTAEAMSASNLGLRIDVGGTESELSDVARALNSAFDRLQGAFERQTQFTADASHELRTPLTTVISEAEWALRRERTIEEHQRAFAVCLRAAHRMREVVDRLLTLARSDAGAETVRREPIDLATIAAGAISELTALAESRGVRIEGTLAPAVVLGDADKIRELIGNLISNAIDYNRPDGYVRISTSSNDRQSVVDVVDCGIGISSQDLPHVFERFYRADAARSRAAGGSGLGLAIAREIAARHGGTIDCESVPGAGTRFVVQFPVWPSHAVEQS